MMNPQMLSHISAFFYFCPRLLFKQYEVFYVTRLIWKMLWMKCQNMSTCKQDAFLLNVENWCLMKLYHIMITCIYVIAILVWSRFSLVHVFFFILSLLIKGVRDLLDVSLSSPSRCMRESNKWKSFFFYVEEVSSLLCCESLLPRSLINIVGPA